MRRWVSLMLLLVLLAGCTGKQPSPQPDPAPAEPEVTALLETTIFRDGPANLGPVEGITLIKQPWGREEAVVGTGQVVVAWRLDQRETGALSERVRSTGHTPDQISTPAGRVEVRFPAGGPERWEVWLEGVKGSKLVLERQPEPTVQIGYRLDGGGLVAVEGSELALPPGRLTLEFRFDRPIAFRSFDLWRSELFERNRGIDLSGTDFVWVEPNRLVWQLPRVPSRLDLALGRMQAASTLLPVNPRSLLVRITGVAVRREGYRLAMSPDGSRLLATNDGHWPFLIPLDGTPPVKLHEYAYTPAHWDGKGARVLGMWQQWRGLCVYSVTSGERQELGDGWPVGWDGDWVYIIRWAGSDSRYIPPIP